MEPGKNDMKQNNILCWCARVSGFLLILSTIPHYFIGLPEVVLKPIAEGKITDPDTAKSFYAIWIFSSITMFMTGATLMLISTDLKYLNKRIWRIALVLSTGIAS